MHTIFISAGEASGDAVGASLLTELRSRGFTGQVMAVGGTKLKQAGAKMIVDSSTWGAVGIWQSLRVAPKIKFTSRPAFSLLRKSPPSLVIPIDFGFFNKHIAKVAKRSGSKVLYFMPPGSWRRGSQGADLPALTDCVATPFEWSADLLREAGCNAHWVGHPVMQWAAGLPAPAVRPFLALMPGSRAQEIQLNLAYISQALNTLELRGLEPVLIAAPTATDELIRSSWRSGQPLPRLWRDGTLPCLLKSRAAIVCSGTATLEAAVCDVPMVVVYETTRLERLQWLLIRNRVKYISMPSVLLDREVVPEPTTGRLSPTELARVVQDLIDNSPARAGQLKAFAEVRSLLGPSDALTRTANLALDMLGR